MTPREISDIFADIELRLIRSLKKHLRVVKGDNIHSWQGRCLRSIERYRRQNATVFSSFSPDVEREVTELLQKSFINGVETVEAEHRLAFPDANLEGAFSGINSDRLDSLIEDVNEHLHTVETSSLRMMDDVYRSVIYKAELAQATGSVTMQQAVDMAVQDFLERGINSIEYADGRRVNIASYAEMALRSASTRSMLRGEAPKRQQLGVDTVLVSQYGACSDTCLPWQGKVYIDDVWGQNDGYDVRDGKAKSINGKWYRLLSEAVEAGLFHPNCRHSVSTWYEGVSKMPTPLDTTAVRRAAELERRQRELERKVRRFKRLEEGSQDEETVAKYRRKRIAAQKQLREFVSDNDDVLRRDYWREKSHKIGKQEPATADQYIERSRNITSNQTKTNLTLSVNDGTLTEDDVHFIDQYKKSGVSYSLNYSLRTKESLSEKERDLIHGIDKALSKLPVYEGIVYRSVRADSLDDVLAFEMQHSPGSIVLYDAYTSSSEEVYDDTMEYQFVITSKRGRDMRMYNPLEKEILFMRGTQFLVTKRIGNTIYMEEI